MGFTKKLSGSLEIIGSIRTEDCLSVNNSIDAKKISISEDMKINGSAFFLNDLHVTGNINGKSMELSETLMSNYIYTKTIYGDNLNLKNDVNATNLNATNDVYVENEMHAKNAIIENHIHVKNIDITNSMNVKNINVDSLAVNNELTISLLNSDTINSGTIKADSLDSNSMYSKNVKSNMVIAKSMFTDSLDSKNVNSKSIDTVSVDAELITTDSLTVKLINSGSIDANSIESDLITVNEIQSKSIITGSVKSVSIESNSIDSKSINAESIDTNSVNSESIDTKTIIADSLDSKKVNTNSLDSDTIKSNSIDSEKVNSKTVVTESMDSKTIVAESTDSKTINTGSLVSETINAGSLVSETINTGSLDSNTIDSEMVNAKNITGKSIILEYTKSDYLNINNDATVKGVLDVELLKSKSIQSGSIESSGPIATDHSFIAKLLFDNTEALLIENKEGFDVFRVDTKDSLVHINNHLNIAFNGNNAGQITLEDSSGNINCSFNLNEHGNLELNNNGSVDILAGKQIRLNSEETIINGKLTINSICSNDVLQLNEGVAIDKNGIIYSEEINIDKISFRSDSDCVITSDKESISVMNSGESIASFSPNGIQTKSVYGLNSVPKRQDEAVSKQYVDSLVFGLRPKESVRVSTVEHGNMDTDFENGSMIDNVVVNSGDRILIKNQSGSGSVDNGIYIIQNSGAPKRANDLDSFSVEVENIENLWGSKLIKVYTKTAHGLEKGDNIYLRNNLIKVDLVSDSFSFNFENKTDNNYSFDIDNDNDKLYIGSHAFGSHVIVREGLENEMMAYICANERNTGDITGYNELKFVLFSSLR